MKDQITQIVTDAVKAMLYEVSVNPKPGLVDPLSAGPHADMDVFLFIDSAESLRPYLQQCAQAGLTAQPTALPQLFNQLRSYGIQAEQTMFWQTRGVNTHKGAIFSLGIAVAAKAYLIHHSQLGFAQVVQHMLVDLLPTDFNQLASLPPEQLTAGQKEFQQYHLTGARGEAATGFPTVFNWGLPMLRQATGTLNECLLDTLMIIAGHSQDSNLVHRAQDPHILTWIQNQVQQYFVLGGSQTVQGKQFLQKLNAEFDQRQLSLGGSADLLIVTIFIALQTGIL